MNCQRKANNPQTILSKQIWALQNTSGIIHLQFPRKPGREQETGKCNSNSQASTLPAYCQDPTENTKEKVTQMLHLCSNMALKFLGRFCELSLGDELAVVNPFRKCLKLDSMLNVNILFQKIVNILSIPTDNHMKSKDSSHS